MKKIITIISVVAVLLSAFSCKKASYEMPDKYKTAESLVVKGSATVVFDAVGGNYTVAIKENDAALEVVVSSEWLGAEVSGQDVKLSCTENMSLLTRYATVTIKSQGKERRLQVKQYGVSYDYFWEESYDFSAAGGSLALKFIPTTLSIKLKVEGSEWIKASVTENTLNVTVAKNETAEERSGKVIWRAGEQIQEFAITQAKGNGSGGGTNPPVGGVIFSEDFENVDNLGGWLFADIDQDGFGWSYGDGIASHSGIGIMFSQSFDNATNKPLTPDNWIVTPVITLGTDNYVSFWVAGQDPDWAKEHYGVYVSSKQPETYGDFEAFEELFEATNPIEDPYESEIKQFQGTDDVKDILWQRIAVKIPATYDNKSVCIGIRHFDCTNMFILNLDDVMVTQGLPAKTATSSVSTSTVKINGNRSNYFLDYKRR